MNPSNQLVAFTLEGQSFALDLGTVHRVVRAIEVTPLPNAPDIILGVINVRGELATVVDLRHRFRMPTREIRPSDQFILVSMPTSSTGIDSISTAQASSDSTSATNTISPTNVPTLDSKIQAMPKPNTRNLALVVDEVTGILDIPPERLVVEEEIVANLEYVQGVAKVHGDLVLIYDLARCLSLHEERLLDDALAKMDT